MKSKSNKVFVVCELIFSLITCIFLAITIILAINAKQFEKDASLTTATITDLGHKKDTSRVTILYEVEGNSYEKTLNEYSSGWDVGDEIAVYYNTSNPAKVRIKSIMYFLPILFGILGGCFLLTVIILEIIRRCSAKKQKRLMETGRKVYATITEVTENYKVRVNGRYPYQAKANYTDEYSGNMYTLKSKNFWESSIDLVGREVPVYINPKNPNDYYMDIEYLFGKKYEL